MNKIDYSEFQQLVCGPETLMQILGGLTPGRISQLAAEGVISKSERGIWLLNESLQGYLRLHAKRRTRSTETEKSERARLVAAKANIAEMEAAEKRGQLVRRDVQIREAFTESRSLRDGFIGLADRLSAELAHMDDEVEIHTRINTEVRQVLDQLIEAEQQRTEELERLNQLEDETP